MGISIIVLSLGSFCAGTLAYLRGCDHSVKSWKIKVMRIIWVSSLIWLLISPVDWAVVFGEDPSSGFGAVSRLISMGFFGVGIFVLAAVVYPLLGYMFQCKMGKILKDILS